MNQENDTSKKIAQHIVSVMLKKKSDREAEFDEWLISNPLAVDTLSELTDETQLESEIKNFSKVDKIAGAQKVLRKVAKRRRFLLVKRSIAVAAAMIAVTFIVWQIVSTSDESISMNQPIAVVNNNENDVRLVLADGEVIWMNRDTIVTNHLALYKHGEKEVSLSVKEESRESSQIKLIVPRMNHYSIVLSDGTKVMLNAESELIFPDQFTGDFREVTLKGEGYFDVAKDLNKPFIIHIDGIKVQVHGTKFNVNGYDRMNVKTYLLEGSVEVSLKNGLKKMLEPNQLIQINPQNGESDLAFVKDGVKYLGWMNNLFLFEGETLEYVIGELSRWYNIEIVAESKITTDVAISGTFKRNLSLDSILESIETVSGVQLVKK